MSEHFSHTVSVHAAALIKNYDGAVREDEMAGSKSRDEAAIIEAYYNDTRTALYSYIGFLEQALGRKSQ